MSKRIVVVGSLNMDMVIHSPKLPIMGETVLGNEFMMVAGGKGANQAVAAARLGGQVTMVGCVGDDSFGQELLNNLIINQVNVENVRVLDKVSTGVALITIVDRDNCIIVAPGSNSKFSLALIENVEKIIKQASVLVIQLEIPLETVQQLIEIAHQNHVRVLLNPAPGMKLSDELLSKIDIITPNESECEIITGIPINNMEDSQAVMNYFLNKGVGQVIITLGNNGVVYNRGQEFIHKHAHQVEIVDTTAAGDAFTGAIAFALSVDKDLDSAVDFANIVGALTVTKKGAQASLPYMSEVLAFHNT